MSTSRSVVLSLVIASSVAAFGCGGGGGGGGGGRVSGGGTSGGGTTTGGTTTGGSTTGGTVVGQTTPITVGGTLADQLFAWDGQYADRHAGAYGLYSAALTAGVPYRLYTTNAHNGGDDPYLYLADPSGAIIAHDDNSGGGLEAAIDFTPPSDGTYIFALRAAARATSGRCDLTLVDATHPAIPGTILAIGSTLAGQAFEWQNGMTNRWDGTYDQVVVTLQAGGIYEFETTGPGTGDPDTYIYLMTANGAILAQDDDSGTAPPYSKITYTAATTGSFAIRLRAYLQGHAGTCSIAARLTGQAPAPQPRQQLNPGMQIASQTFEWQQSYANREDGQYGEYSIDMTGGTTYTIQTTGATGGTDDTFLYLMDSNLVKVAEDDDGAGNLQARIVFTPASSATYVVRLRAWGRGTSGACTIAANGGAAGGTPLYPDLRPLADQPNGYMYDVYFDTSAGQHIRFSNANFNGGTGDMALRMINNAGTMIAYQRITTTTGAIQERSAGQFVFAAHATHNHYHFDHFNDYNLRSITAGNGVGGIVATSNKVSFCLIDIDHYDPSLQGPSSVNYDCNNQGISVGWADVYSSGLDGQDIDVGAIADGTYWLESVVDPADLLTELDNTNNTARIKVQINHAAHTATVVP